MKSDLSKNKILAALTTDYVGRNLIFLQTTSSTQDRALKEASLGAPQGTVVVANTQTAGRGRFHRPWISPVGSDIYLSLLLKPQPEHLMKLNMVSTLAIIRAIRITTGLECQIKWPNDIQIGGRKLAGMMVDTVLENQGPSNVVIGIGLNVRLNPSEHEEIATTATSLFRELGTDPGRLDIVIALLQELEVLYEETKAGRSLLPEWRHTLITLGQKINITRPGDPSNSATEQGIAEDVDEDGTLMLRKTDGTIINVVAGEVSLQQSPPPVGGVL